jgi:hypothetical protein
MGRDYLSILVYILLVMLVFLLIINMTGCARGLHDPTWSETHAKWKRDQQNNLQHY